MWNYKLVAICIICIEAARTHEVNLKPIIKSLHINSDIKYCYSKTYVVSSILNPAQAAQDVNFTASIPDKAFITGLTITIDGKKYDSHLVGENASATGSEKSSLVDSQEFRFSKMFSLTVKVGSLKTITFNLTYEELLPRNLNVFYHETYVTPKQFVEDLSVVVNIEDDLNIIFGQITTYSPRVELDELEYKIKANRIRRAPNKLSVVWKPNVDDQKYLDDNGLNGRIVTLFDLDAVRKPLQTLVDSDGEYFAQFLRLDDNSTVESKHVVFVLDVSRSMAETKLNQTKEALENILSTLPPTDYFSIVLFSSGAVAWTPTEPTLTENLKKVSQSNIEERDDYVVPASEDNINAAKEFMQSVESINRANVIVGLTSGLKVAFRGKELLSKSPQPLSQMIIFITAGDSEAGETKSENIVQRMRELKNEFPIFSLGFGNHADITFLRHLSASNGGIARRIYEASDAAVQIQLFYNQLASPVPYEDRFTYKLQEVEDVTSEYFRTPFKGSQLLVLGRYKSKQTRGNQNITDSNEVTTVLTNDKFGYVEKMWAYVTLKHLQMEFSISEKETVRNKAKELALKYSFLTPFTSLHLVYPDKNFYLDF